MGAHGKYTEPVTDADVRFMADNYAMVATGTHCGGNVNLTHTIDEEVHSTAVRIKQANPSVKVGMYWRSDFALELKDCSGWASEWAAHPEWRLKNDKGEVIDRGEGIYYYDYTIPEAAAFFANVLVNTTLANMPSTPPVKPTTTTGARDAVDVNPIPVLDFVFVDGMEGLSGMTSFHHGIGPERSAKLMTAKYAAIGGAQRRLDALGRGGALVYNGLDEAWGAAKHVSSGGVASMFDHWSILQFLNRSSALGEFNRTIMEGAFVTATLPVLANHTLQIKGWPGPIVRQRDHYPSGLVQPETPEDFQRVAAQRFNSELALFLLVASERDFWIYSWFWDWDNYVPGHPDSTVPPDFFPQAKCKLGAPLGPRQKASDGTWNRAFAHARVHVDLVNRSASRVDFDNTAC